MSLTAIAKTPAKGPKPTTLMKMRAQIRASTPLMTSKKRRMTKWTPEFETIFLAPKNPRGIAAREAKRVPKKAMAKVSRRA